MNFGHIYNTPTKIIKLYITFPSRIISKATTFLTELMNVMGLFDDTRGYYRITSRHVTTNKSWAFT
jgi:hypothetical protein